MNFLLHARIIILCIKIYDIIFIIFVIILKLDSDRYMYAALMRNTSEQVFARMLELLSPLREEDLSLYNLCMEMPEHRRKRFMVRAYLARASYEAAGGSDWQQILDFCAATEIETVSMYYTNRLFDEKGGKYLLADRSNQTIAAILTRDIASRTFSSFVQRFAPDKSDALTHLFNQADELFYIGQYRDINLNIYQKDLVVDERSFDLYLYRCYGINAAFIERIAAIGASLANASIEQVTALTEFGKNYGIALQITNDISDFVPAGQHYGTSEKTPHDSYSDILHHKLTAPILFALKDGPIEDQELIRKALEGKITKNQFPMITARLMKNGCMDSARKLARHYANKAKASLRLFSIQARRPLSLMTVIIHSNRYYKSLDAYRL